jgi:hypothetical protein
MGGNPQYVLDMLHSDEYLKEQSWDGSQQATADWEDSTCCNNELLSLWISDIATVTCSRALHVFNKPIYKTPHTGTPTRDIIIIYGHVRLL